MTGFISIADMMRHMNNGLPFSLVYVTYTFQTGRGGSVKRIDMATKCWAKNIEPEKEQVYSSTITKSKKNPNNFHNSTITIRISAAGQADIRTVHVRLIRQFNGATVL